MRGEAIRKLRAENLRLLNETCSFEQMARLADVDATYLSQIANEYIGKGRKSPRGLSDNYAEKIEAGLGLEPGWFDQVNAESSVAIAVNDSPSIYAEKKSPATGTATKPGEVVEIIDYKINEPAMREALDRMDEIVRDWRDKDNETVAMLLKPIYEKVINEKGRNN